MKIKYSNRAAERGTALLVALFLTTILAVTIAGYLRHSSQQNFLSVRSQTWNLSIAVSESGVEEAMQHLNSNPANLAVDGWSQSGNIYTVSRTLDANTRYTVSIDNVNPLQPIITSQAFIADPTFTASTPSSTFAAAGTTVGGQTQESVKRPEITRVVRVTAGRSGLLLKAMVAKHTINMNGNTGFTDSFNSTSPSNSINGRYPAGQRSKLLDNGDVASNDSIINVVSAGNYEIFGRVAVGPGGTASTGPNGGVGTRAWQDYNNGIQPGYFTDDMNFTFPTVELPYTTGLTPTSGSFSTTNATVTSSTNTVTSATYPSPAPASGVSSNIVYTTVATKPSPVPYGTVTNILTTATSASTLPAAGTYVGTVTKKGSKWYYDKITGYSYTYPTYTFTYSTATTSTNYTVTTKSYDYVLQGGAANMPPVDYYVDSIGKANILVIGNARLVVRGNVKQSGQDTMIIAPDGRLEMWVGGTSVDLTGQGVMNQNGYAQNFMLWCTDSVTELKYAGNGEFTGVVIAPNANVKLAGGGNGPEDFIGALIANTITLNGHYSFHYDEALRNYRNNGRFMVTKWDEVPASMVTTTASN